MVWAKLKSGVSLMEQKGGKNRILCSMKLVFVPPDLSEVIVLFWLIKQEMQSLCYQGFSRGSIVFSKLYPVSNSNIKI